jgi:hypothetical protein
MILFDKWRKYMSRKRITVAVEQALVKELRLIAVQREMKFSDLLDQALTQFVQKPVQNDT